MYLEYGVFLGPQLGALFNPFFGWEGSPTRIDYRNILSSLLEDLDMGMGQNESPGYGLQVVVMFPCFQAILFAYFDPHPCGDVFLFSELEAPEWMVDMPLARTC